ncbi:TIGR04255 family protein [Pantoea sp. SIMBA_079]|uniref:TIGR04255 family protein n=1 Tax=Pantoea sp. SIMBA_079 TaxID=3085817 RepID=UPI003993AB1F
MNENLIYVLAKVDFGRITESRFKDRSDAVQEALRKDYPIVNENNILTTIQFDFNKSNEHKINQSNERIINLCSSNRDWGIRITQNFLMLQTKRYDGFDKFINRMRAILTVIEKEFELYHSAFVGIRFVNKFQYNGDDDFKDVFRRRDFIQPELHFDNSLKAGSNLNAHYFAGFNNLKINSGIMIDGPKVAGEFTDLPSDLGIQSDEILEGVWAHLDIDCFYNEPDVLNDFSVEDITEKYSALRKLANEAYVQIIFAKIPELS